MVLTFLGFSFSLGKKPTLKLLVASHFCMSLLHVSSFLLLPHLFLGGFLCLTVPAPLRPPFFLSFQFSFHFFLFPMRPFYFHLCLSVLVVFASSYLEPFFCFCSHPPISSCYLPPPLLPHLCSLMFFYILALSSLSSSSHPVVLLILLSFKYSHVLLFVSTSMLYFPPFSNT